MLPAPGPGEAERAGPLSEQPGPCSSQGAASCVVPAGLWTRGIRESPPPVPALQQGRSSDSATASTAQFCPSPSSSPRSLGFLIRRAGAGVLSLEGGDQLEGHLGPRLRCPEESGRKGAHPEPASPARQRALGLTDCPNPPRVPGPRPTVTRFHRRRSSTCPRSRAPPRLRPNLPSPPPPPSPASGLDARRPLSRPDWRLESPLARFLDSESPVPAVVTTTSGEKGGEEAPPRPRPWRRALGFKGWRPASPSDSVHRVRSVCGAQEPGVAKDASSCHHVW